MKKMLFVVIFIFLTLALTVNAEEPKKIYKLQKSYIYLDESLLVSDTDLNCSYFFKDDMPQDIRIEASYQSVDQRIDFSDNDQLFIDKGSKNGFNKGDLLLIMSQGKSISGLGRYYQKKSLAEIIAIYEYKSLIQLKSGCYPVNIGDFAAPFKPEKIVFAKKIDYMLARIPANPVSGEIVFAELTSGQPASISASSQYVTVDLGQGVVAKGTFLLFYRVLKSDLPPLIIGLGIVVQAENTNSTVKILDANSDIKIKDQAFILPANVDKVPDVAEAGKMESIPIVETLQIESQDRQAPQEGAAQPAEPNGDVLTVDVFFDFDSKLLTGDHNADFTAIKDFINAKAEYLVTLRGYTCSIGDEEYNLRLARERVEVIKNTLVSQYGVDAAHVETFFYGEKEPRFDNSSETERQKNRLVKIEVSGK